MTMPAETIDHATLEHLVSAGAVKAASVVAQSGGWGVVIAYGTAVRALAAKRGAVRIFRKFETLASHLKNTGIVQYKWTPGNMTQWRSRSRPNARTLPSA